MNNDSRKLRFGLWYDFRNPLEWRKSSDRLYREILDQIARRPCARAQPELCLRPVS